MTTELDKPLRRAVMIGRDPYVITITPSGLKVTGKGRRKGIELEWRDLISGEAALATALNASLREVAPRRSSEAPGRKRT